MASKKQAKSIPQIYTGLDTTKQGTELCLVVDKSGQVFKFDNQSVVSIVKEGIAMVWPSFNVFDDKMAADHASFARLHEQVFKAPLDKKTDEILARVYVWKKLVQMAADRTNAGNPINQSKQEDPVTGRKSTIGARKYHLGTDAKQGSYEQTCLKTPQAIACFRIFIDGLVECPEGITEAALKQKVMERAGELHTRQDPWRIFQYYRPELIRCHLLRHD